MRSYTFAQLVLAASSALARVDPWTEQFGGTPDLSFSGITTFAHLPHERCLDSPATALDIALIGMPFDNAVSFRPGARFGPYGIRSGSRRQRPDRGYSAQLQLNPYKSAVDILDCGDVPVTPFDTPTAIKQIKAAYTSLLHHPVVSAGAMENLGMIKGLDGLFHPRLIALGGDHTIVLPILHALSEVYGPVSVIHLDAHIDTWNPNRYYGAVSVASGVNHGTFFWHAYEQGYIKANASIHAGIRTKFSSGSQLHCSLLLTTLGAVTSQAYIQGPIDLEDDVTAGFDLISTWDLDERGVEWIAEKIKARVGSGPVVISLDVDVLDPSYVPATGTPETGGWTTRELRRILHSLRGLNIVGMDVVELAPAYDTNAEISALAAADVVYDFLSLLTMGVEGKEDVVNSPGRDEL